MLKYKLPFLLLFSLIANVVYANNSSELPISLVEKMSFVDEDRLEFTSLDSLKLQREDILRSQQRMPYRYAINRHEKVKGEFISKGQWLEKGDTSIWRLPVSAADAHSLSFGFENLFLPSGAKLFIFDSTGSQSYVYTDADNKAHKKLWTPMIEGDTAFVEINVPTALKRYLSFDINSISQGYRGFKVNDRAKSGSCNIDVVCPDGDDWRNEIRSVAHYNFSSGGSRFVCSGQLVNNTSQNREPYFLTAAHCVSTAAEVQSMVFFWNFETTVCDGTPNGSRAQTQSGASLVSVFGGGSGISQADTVLVKLDNDPSASFNVHWAGWDANDIAPSSSVTIHHPAGDEKRISFDDDPALITNYTQSTPLTNGTHLRIGAWNKGTTEGGSSGSGLWNADKRIVGVLSGGTASCDRPNDPDWYGRFASAWLGGGTTTTQLKAWLDPANTGALTLDGSDACTAPTVTFSISANPAEVGQAVGFTSNVNNGTGSGYTYAWDFDGDGVTDSTEASPSYTYDSVYQGNVSLSVDEAGCSGGASAAIVVTHAGGNTAPVANVAMATLTVNEGDAVSLDASSSSDANGDALTYVWTQTAGPGVTLTNANSAIASFTTPATSSDTTLAFQVTVTDIFNDSDTENVTVAVTDINQAPVASITPTTITVNEGADVNLDASSSSDSDGDALTYAWTQLSGPSVTLTNGDSSMPSFTAPEVTATTVFEFELTVTDPDGLTGRATVTVNVNNVLPPPPPPAPSSGGGALNFGLLLVMFLLKIRNHYRSEDQ